MKVLVAGASGFLGRAVVPAVAASGHEVVALVEPKAKLDALAWPNSVRILRGDPPSARRLVETTRGHRGGGASYGNVQRRPSSQFGNGGKETERLLDRLPCAR